MTTIAMTMKSFFGALLLLSTPGCALLGAPTEPAPTPPKECTQLAYREAAPILDRPTLEGAGARALRTAQAAIDEGRLAEALPLVERAHELDQSNIDILLTEAMVVERLGSDVERVLRLRAQAVVVEPADPRTHIAFATTLRGTGEVDAAVTHFKCALLLDPTNDEAIEGQAATLLETGDPRAAETALKAPPQLTPRGRLLLADALQQQGRYVEAGRALRDAASTETAKPARVMLLRRAARVLREGGASEEADSADAEADRLDPPPPERKLRKLPKS